jgi:hypothetical protein
MGALVECHSEYAYAERPIGLTWEGRRLEIVKILAEWRTPDEKHFRIRTQDGQQFELSYRETTLEWQVYQP